MNPDSQIDLYRVKGMHENGSPFTFVELAMASSNCATMQVCLSVFFTYRTALSVQSFHTLEIKRSSHLKELRKKKLKEEACFDLTWEMVRLM